MKQNKEKNKRGTCFLVPYRPALAPNLIGCCDIIGPVPPSLFIRFHYIYIISFTFVFVTVFDLNSFESRKTCNNEIF